ncbi:MAG: aminotransferase class I/II-fold pyridoxal phosphate-dependent enzyme, partial [Veillonella parvula]|nr:aminotransferase class I/II-fold pyridoxal phosphate-dependent enzyme [Veillonella parvula]
MSNQEKMPFVEALESYKEQHFVPFHTPGHKIGVEAPQLLKNWMGPALPYDLGVMYALDDLHEPERELKEAQDLTAELYGADCCWFSINGTTALIEAMIMGTVGPDEIIIIPREAHRSVISGLVLSGAKPVYMDCDFDERWGIPLGVSLENAIKSMDAHPEAKAILLVYPNYYGVGIDIVNIIQEAHKRELIVLVDEAHGPHLPFSESLPIEATEAGADLVAQSTHKSVGSLTQTSWLLGQGKKIDKRRITQMHQMLQSTSPNYIFLASLDMARHQLATAGNDLVSRAVELSMYLREELNKISGIA